MHNVTIEKSLYDDIVDFCSLNEITDVNEFINKTLKKGFDMEKYGDSFAFFFNKTPEEIVHIKPKEQEIVEEVEPEAVEKEVKTEVVAKKRGRKKKEEPKVEEIIPEPEVIIPEAPIEPVYKIKEEEPKKTEKKYVTLKNKKDDNYDVYDEI
jgi:hypothetical protein